MIKSTLGFSPDVTVDKDAWLSPEGRHRFLELVRRRLQAHTGLQQDDLTYAPEMETALVRALIQPQDGERVENLPRPIYEAMNYVTEMFRTRQGMHDRLNIMRNFPTYKTLTPRPDYANRFNSDAERVFQPPSQNAHYETFVHHQQKWRHM